MFVLLTLLGFVSTFSEDGQDEYEKDGFIVDDDEDEDVDEKEDKKDNSDEERHRKKKKRRCSACPS